MTTSILHKYSAALFVFALAVLNALQSVGTANVNLNTETGRSAVVQLGLVFLGAGLTFALPLLDAKWAGALKTGVGIVVTVLTLAAPFIIAGHITGDQVVTVLLSALQNVAGEVGIAVRQDAAALEAKDYTAGVDISSLPAGSSATVAVQAAPVGAVSPAAAVTATTVADPTADPDEPVDLGLTPAETAKAEATPLVD